VKICAVDEQLDEFYRTWLYIAQIKKENQIILIYKEIQNGAVAKSYNGFLIYLHISSYIRSLSSSMTFLLFVEHLIFFFISVEHPILD